MKKTALSGLLLLALLAAQAEAQFGKRGRLGGGGGGGGGGEALPERERPAKPDFVAQATGLVPQFPEGMHCAGIASAYGSRSRYDGSSRPFDINGGTHGGMDLSLTTGTPLLAVADGDVIHAGSGGQMEGHFLWLRFPPASTGLPVWTFAKYQHLAEPSPLGAGTPVKRGQPVARGGNTGTLGGHYGAEGYAHLHLSTFYGPSGEYDIFGLRRNMVRGHGAVSGDPMLLYYRDLKSLDDIPGFSAPGLTVAVGVVTADGHTLPADSRSVWPLACTAAP